MVVTVIDCESVRVMRLADTYLTGIQEATVLRNIMPKEESFFVLFEASAANIQKAAAHLNALVNEWTNVGDRVAQIDELEHEGDSITHKIMEQLHRTFVTPFDREDIALLAHSLDDVTDFIQSAADSMLIYKVEKPGEPARELAAVIMQASNEIVNAMPMLRHHTDFKALVAKCVEMNRLENVADGIYRTAISELFDNTKDVTQIIKWREIYEHMESATDRAEDVANVLEGVALKHG
jgi:uncharacterized protein